MCSNEKWQTSGFVFLSCFYLLLFFFFLLYFFPSPSFRQSLIDECTHSLNNSLSFSSLFPFSLVYFPQHYFHYQNVITKFNNKTDVEVNMPILCQHLLDLCHSVSFSLYIFQSSHFSLSLSLSFALIISIYISIFPYIYI